MEKFIENPMTIDSLWNDLDELERQIIEEEEAERKNKTAAAPAKPSKSTPAHEEQWTCKKCGTLNSWRDITCSQCGEYR